MLRKTIFLLLVLSSSLFGEPELVYKNKKTSLLQELSSKKTTYLSENITFSLDFMSAYLLLSEEERQGEFSDFLQHKNPDKVLFTLSYKF